MSDSIDAIKGIDARMRDLLRTANVDTMAEARDLCYKIFTGEATATQIGKIRARKILEAISLSTIQTKPEKPTTPHVDQHRETFEMDGRRGLFSAARMERLFGFLARRIKKAMTPKCRSANNYDLYDVREAVGMAEALNVARPTTRQLLARERWGGTQERIAAPPHEPPERTGRPTVNVQPLAGKATKRRPPAFRVINEEEFARQSQKTLDEIGGKP